MIVTTMRCRSTEGRGITAGGGVDRLRGAESPPGLKRRAWSRAQGTEGGSLQPSRPRQRDVRGAVQAVQSLSVTVEAEESKDFTAPYAMQRREHLVKRWFILAMHPRRSPRWRSPPRPAHGARRLGRFAIRVFAVFLVVVGAVIAAGG